MTETLENLGLSAALAASEKRSALFEDSERRAFVSERNQNFDLGVRSQMGKVTKFDQTREVLHSILAKHGVPDDSGWKPS
jgi:hypothetical protein